MKLSSIVIRAGAVQNSPLLQRRTGEIPQFIKMYNLNEKEETVFEVRPSIVVLLYHLVPILLADVGLIIIFSNIQQYLFLVVIGILIIGLFVVCVLVANWYMTTYRVTNKRVESKSGIMGFTEEEISLDDVQHVDVKRTFMGMIFNYGTVLCSAAGSNASVEFTNISNPKIIATKIEDLAIEAEVSISRSHEGDRIVEK